MYTIAAIFIASSSSSKARMVFKEDNQNLKTHTTFRALSTDNQAKTFVSVFIKFQQFYCGAQNKMQLDVLRIR